MAVKDLSRVTLALARGPGHPNGDAAFGYDIIAPLNDDGHLDAEMWKADRAACTVRRFRPGDDDRFGMLVRKPGGADGATWVIDYDKTRDDDDEAGYRLDRHLFRVGEYVTFRESGVEHAFRIVDVHAFK